jgi:aminoglycoside phosphotransferase (APT) family kinase protein
MTDPQLRKIAEGREAEIFAWQDGAVLRLLRDPNAQRQIAWEAEAMAAAGAAGVRVPAPGELTTVDGRPGLVMERIDGIDMLTLIGRRPWSVWRAGRVWGEIQAGMHEVVAPVGLPALRDLLRGRIESCDPAVLPERLARLALDELERLPDGDRLCHGDLHPGNIMEAQGEHVVIDWTNATRGDPAADFTRSRLLGRLGDVPPGTALVVRVGAKFARRLLLDSYVRSYRRGRALDLALVARWEIAVAAARMRDGIESEHPKVLRLLEVRADNPSP